MVKIILFIFAFLACCNGEEFPPSLAYPAGEGGVVAEACGVKIYASQLEEVLSETGLQPREALEKMIDEIVLADEAAKRDFSENRSVLKNWKKALVQKILDEEVEKKVPKESIKMEDIKKHYVQNYENRGLLLENVRDEIHLKLLVEKRNRVYNKFVKSLEEKSEAIIYYDKLEEKK